MLLSNIMLEKPQGDLKDTRCLKDTTIPQYKGKIKVTTCFRQKPHLVNNAVMLHMCLRKI